MVFRCVGDKKFHQHQYFLEAAFQLFIVYFYIGIPLIGSRCFLYFMIRCYFTYLSFFLINCYKGKPVEIEWL